MDREQIKSQRLVERYLSGDLLMREAREFERFCFTNPDVLQSLALPARLRERLLRGATEDATPSLADVPAVPGRAVPRKADNDDDSEDENEDAPRPRFDRSRLLAAGLGLLVLVAAALLWEMNSQKKEIKTLHAAVRAVSLRPPASVQLVKLAPSDNRPAQPQYTVALKDAQLLDLHIDTSGTSFTSFEVTIDKVDQARVVQIKRMASDSNKELRMALNSTAFGAGEYEIRILGYDWRGNTTPVGWLVLAMH